MIPSATDGTHRPQTVKNFSHTENEWGKKRKYYQFTLILLCKESEGVAAHHPSPALVLEGGPAGERPGGHAEHSSHKRSATLRHDYLRRLVKPSMHKKDATKATGHA